MMPQIRCLYGQKSFHFTLQKSPQWVKGVDLIRVNYSSI